MKSLYNAPAILIGGFVALVMLPYEIWLRLK